MAALSSSKRLDSEEKPMASFPLVSATGMLGSGYRAESLDKAIELGARMIGCDAGSTDPGPGPLATGTCMFSKAAVKRDTEIMVSRAVAAGFAPSVVWHMAKILECGAAAVAHRLAPDSMMAVVHDDAFDVFPLREDYRCTPQSVASHTLYENADPFDLREPSGTLDTREARYEAISDKAVRGIGVALHRRPGIHDQARRRPSGRLFDDP